MQLSQKQKTFSLFFAPFLKSSLNFKRFENKDDPRSFCMFEVTDSENVFRETSKKSRFRGYFDKQYGKRAQTLLNLPLRHIYHTRWSLTRKLFSKKSLWLTCQIFGLLVNTLATDEKYPVLNRDNLMIAIQIQLSQKQKGFYLFFGAFSKSSWNFKRLEKRWTS